MDFKRQKGPINADPHGELATEAGKSVRVPLPSLVGMQLFINGWEWIGP